MELLVVVTCQQGCNVARTRRGTCLVTRTCIGAREAARKCRGSFSAAGYSTSGSGRSRLTWVTSRLFHGTPVVVPVRRPSRRDVEQEREMSPLFLILPPCHYRSYVTCRVTLCYVIPQRASWVPVLLPWRLDDIPELRCVML